MHYWPRRIAPLLMAFLLASFTSAVSQTAVPANPATPGVGGEAPEKPVLTATDINRFIETLPKMSKELEALGQRLDVQRFASAVEALAANEQVQAIFKKYGWKVQEFYTKFGTIAAGFAVAEMEKQLADLPANQRAMVESAMKGQMPQIDLNPKDLALIRSKLPALRKLFESLE